MTYSLRLIVATLALTLTAAAPAERVPTTVKVGALAPDFELKLVDGSKVTFDQLRGNVIVLNFWATWCVPCRTELPLLDAYYRKLKDKGLRVYAVTTEDSLPVYKLKPLFAKLAIHPVKSVKGPYDSLGAVPTNIVIDRAGRVRYSKAGAFDLDGLNAVLIPMMNERAPPTPS